MYIVILKTGVKIMCSSGNVFFTVSGYMNRGIHEGKVGIAVYYYNASTNTVEEQVFIPSNQSEEIIMAL